MKETGRAVYHDIVNLILTAASVAEFYFYWRNFVNGKLVPAYDHRGNFLIVAVYAFLTIVFFYAMGGYKVGSYRRNRIALSLTIGALLADFADWMVAMLIAGSAEHAVRLLVGYVILFLVQTVSLFIIAMVAISLQRSLFPPYQLLQITGQHFNMLPQKMNSRRDKYVIAEEISCDEPLDVIKAKIDEYDATLINDTPAEIRNAVLKYCFERKKRVYFTPKISDIMVRGANELDLFDTPIYYRRNRQTSFWFRMIKRIGDIVIASIGIILTSPIMLITAIAVKKYDDGPVFYKQTRSTLGGKEFKLIKFRSMIVNAEAKGEVRLAQEHDSRITPIGRFIRATRIDELPQFFNILAGDMSIVGPRPERPELIAKYCEEVPEFAYRLRVKAGLTGYAQVYGKYNTTSYDKLKLDMIYVEKQSILLDLQLILLTIRVIFTKESTEGLQEGEMDADVRSQNKNE